MDKDVFESFGLKSSSKPAHTAKSSNDSNCYIDDMVSSPYTKPNTILTSSIRSDKYRPRQYIFGSIYNSSHNIRKPTDEPAKENIFEKHQTTAVAAAAASPNTRRPSNIDNNEPNTTADDSDRFKTITINHLRRSFRDSFLDSAKPAKGREHQQLWFIDVNDKRERHTANESHATNGEYQDFEEKHFARHAANCDNNDNVGTIQAKSSSSVKRNETFRIDSKAIGNNDKRTTISRHSTFRINKNRSPTPESIAGDQSNSPECDYSPGHLSNLNKKPIAITAPYSALNDEDYPHHSPSPPIREHPIRHSTSTNRTQCRFNYEPFTSKSNEEHPNSIPDPYDARNPFQLAKTIIKIRPPFENDDRISNYVPTQQRDAFEDRSKPKRQSFNDLNSTFDRCRENRSFASLRTKLENSAAYRPSASFQIMSKRSFVDDGRTLNKSSFVPYRGNVTHTPITSNRPSTTPISNKPTTIRFIDYNSKQKNEPINNARSNEHTFSIPLTSTSSKSPVISKSRPNKGRSVNFEPIECEVRLISPNYDTKPRRKDSWKSKPANDWTFNKVHI